MKRKQWIKYILLSIFIFITFDYSFADTLYYVNALNGNDNNNGFSPSSAWKTIGKVNSSTFQPGDRILFSRGQEWREVLKIPSSGVQGNLITFGAYGTGAKPIINGSDLLSGWIKAKQNVWKKSELSNVPTEIFINGVRSCKELKFSTLYKENEFFHESNTLYIYSSSNPDTLNNPGIEETRRTGIYINKQDFIKVDNIHIKNGETWGILLGERSNDIIIENCTIEYCGLYGIACNNADGPDVTNIIIRNCTVRYNKGTGIYAGRHSYNWTIDSNIIHNNCAGSDPTYAGMGGIKVHGSHLSGGHTIQNNVVYSNGYDSGLPNTGVGIWLDYADNTKTTKIRYNKCFSNKLSGIEIEFSSNNEAYYNICYLNGQSGIYLAGDSFDPVSGNIIYNNTCYGNSTAGIQVHGRGGADTVTNNTFKNNIAVNNNYRELYCKGGGENDGTNGRGNVYIFNCFGSEYFRFIEWGHGNAYSTYESWETVYGNETNSTEADPSFTNTANADFTLMSSSPCIDNGTNVGLSRDHSGITVPQGSAVDVGAFEYVASSPLSVDITAFPNSGWIPLTVGFTSSVSGGQEPYTYSWNFGDGASSTAQHPSYTFTKASTYTVVLTVNDSSNGQNQDSIIINAASISDDISLSISSKTGTPAQGSGGTTNPAPGIYLYTMGSSVPISAIENTNYRFSVWTGDVANSDAYKKNFTLTMDLNKSISANFCSRCGDVSGDLRITPTDAQMIFDLFLGRIQNPTPCQRDNADVNCSGTSLSPEITPTDAQAVFDNYLGLRELPCDCSIKSRSNSIGFSQVQNSYSENIIISINANEAFVGDEIAIPIFIESPLSLSSFGFDMTYPTHILQFVAISRAELTKDFNQVEGFEYMNGELRIGGYSSKAIIGNSYGELLVIHFKIIREIKGQLELFITNSVDDFQRAIVVTYRI